MSRNRDDKPRDPIAADSGTIGRPWEKTVASPVIAPEPPKAPAVAPKPTRPLRTVYDVRAAGAHKWQLVEVLYGDGLSEERVLMENDSGAIVAGEYLMLTKRAALPAMTGFVPEGVRP